MSTYDKKALAKVTDLLAQDLQYLAVLQCDELKPIGIELIKTQHGYEDLGPQVRISTGEYDEYDNDINYYLIPSELLLYIDSGIILAVKKPMVSLANAVNIERL